MKEREATREQVKMSRGNLSSDQQREQNKKDKHRKRDERDGSTKRKRLAEVAIDDNDLTPFIDDAVRQAKKKLHQTKHPDDPTQHKAHVCIVCDCFIKATEPLRTMDRKQLKAHRHRLGIREYEIYHQVTLNNLLISQYHVPTLPYMLLLQRSRKIGRGWVTCAHCRSSLRSDNRSSTKPPKFAIANGFAIGEFPQEIM